MAREIWCWRRGLSLLPANEQSAEELEKVTTKQWVKVKITEPRNWLLTRKWFALLHVVFPHQDTWPTFESFRKAITVALGFGQVITAKNGDKYMEADSVAIDKMDEDTFQALYKRTELLILEKILPGVNREDLDREVEEFMNKSEKRRG